MVASWGVTVKGSLHKKLKLPNQDCFGFKTFSWGEVMVVCDGMGSSKWAHLGSRMACKAVIETTALYARKAFREPQNFLKLIYEKWLNLISPLEPSLCQSTCLFAMTYEDKALIAQLGDGMIACVNKEKTSLPLDEGDKLFSNLTCGLGEKFNFKTWKVKELELLDLIAIVLCTDGIADDLKEEKKTHFAKDVAYFFRDLKSSEQTLMLKKALYKWPVPKHLDDKTLACLYVNKEALK